MCAQISTPNAPFAVHAHGGGFPRESRNTGHFDGTINDMNVQMLLQGIFADSEVASIISSRREGGQTMPSSFQYARMCALSLTEFALGKWKDAWTTFNHTIVGNTDATTLQPCFDYDRLCGWVKRASLGGFTADEPMGNVTLGQWVRSSTGVCCPIISGVIDTRQC